jgi:zinc D-Ala-D-Ala dipeptidase
MAIVLTSDPGSGIHKGGKQIVRHFKFTALVLVLVCTCVLWPGTNSYCLPDGFVYVETVIPDIKIELRYFTGDNFIGSPVDGYLKPSCILTKEAAAALKEAQEELNTFGLGLKIYDAYRPQQAVDHFVRWAKDLRDTKMKDYYYPNVEKGNLFHDGYIAQKSSHSRGSTVDLTIISFKESEANTDIDMGTTFDFFDTRSWPNDLSISASQRAHRLLLQMIMKKHGFESYPKEWWHFTLKNEPYPDTYFDFPIE